jgi:oligopeptidase B
MRLQRVHTLCVIVYVYYYLIQVYRKDLYPEGPRNCRAPTMLYGYGCYGASIEPDFDSTRLSYLDRGMCYIIAHIR